MAPSSGSRTELEDSIEEFLECMVRLKRQDKVEQSLAN